MNKQPAPINYLSTLHQLQSRRLRIIYSIYYMSKQLTIWVALDNNGL